MPDRPLTDQLTDNAEALRLEFDALLGELKAGINPTLTPAEIVAILAALRALAEAITALWRAIADRRRADDPHGGDDPIPVPTRGFRRTLSTGI